MFKMNMRRVWVYFRAGHGTYLMYTLTMSNFILIFWGLGLKNIGWFTQYFPNLWMFIVVFTALYIPVAIIMGRWHYRTQMPTETDLQYTNSPIMMQLVNDVKEIKEELKKWRIEATRVNV